MTSSCCLSLRDAGFLPPLNVYSHQHPPQAKPVTPTPAPLPLPPPPPPPRRSPRNFSQTDGETSGYHSDNHLVDPASQRHPARHRPEPLQPAVADHLQQLSTSRSFHVPPQTSVSDHHYLQLLPQGSLPIPPHTSVPEHYHHGHEHGHAGMPRADYKFLERRKWIQDGTVPYELYGEVSDTL